MAEAAAAPLTDEQLQSIVGKATQEDLNNLTDDEASRLESLLKTKAKPTSQSAPKDELGGVNTEVLQRMNDLNAVLPKGAKFQLTMPGAAIPPPGAPAAPPPIEANPQANDPTYRDPLAGKPTIQQFERAKVMAQTPSMTASIPGDVMPGPPVPTEGPKSVQDFIQSLGQAIGTAADRPAEAASPERMTGGPAMLSDPSIAEQRLRAQQDSLIGQNMGLGAIAPTEADPRAAAALGSMALGAIHEGVASTAEFLANPVRQLATRPIEFGANALQAGLWLHGAGGALKALKDAPEAAGAAIDALKSAPPAEIAGAQAALDTKIQEVDHFKHMARQFGGDPELMGRLRELEKGIEGAQSTIAEASAGGEQRIQSRAERVNNLEDVISKAEEPGPDQEQRFKTAYKTFWREAAEAMKARGVPPEDDSLFFMASPRMDELKGRINALESDHPWTSSGVTPEAGAQPELPTPLADAVSPSAPDVPAEAPAAKTAPGQEVETGDGYKYKYVGEMPGKKGEPAIRYWKTDKPMPVTGDTGRVTEEMIRKNGLQVPGEKVAEAAVPREVSLQAPTVKSAITLPEALSLTGPGAIMVAGAHQDDKSGLPPNHGSPLSLRNALWAVPAGMFAYGIARYFTDAPFRQALNQFTRLDKTGPADLEKVFERFIVPMLPDTPASGAGQIVPAASVGAGALLGGLVGSKMGQDEPNPAMGALGALVGGALGATMAKGLASQFRTNMTYRDIYRSFFTEAGGMSPEAVAAKQATRIALEGRVREIRDVSNALDKLDFKTQGLVQGWMSGNVNIDQVPRHARMVAANARLIFDELTMDLLKSGLVKDNVLKEALESNIGTYLPRLFLRYELESSGPEVVANWLKAQGKDWGYISSKNYLKARADIPADVLEALGEIKDNPGYLLARRGVVTASDVEQARYHRLLLASPENTIPTRTIREAKQVEAANAATIKEGATVEFPPDVRLYSAEGGLNAAEWQGRTYWQMPDNPRYGLLRGKYVEQSVANDIRSTVETTSGLAKLFQAPLSAFKYFKAVMNPASQFRNIITNTIFADIEAGISPWRMDKWATGFNDLRSGNDWYRRARRAGTFGGEFTAAEIMDLLDSHVEKSTSMMDFIGNTIPAYAAKPANFFTKWHQQSEAWARMTTFRHAVETMGMDDATASAFARRTIPDYQDVQRWVKVVRSSPFGAPFISFSYKAIPRSLEAAFAFGDPKKMMRFWKYPLVMAGLNEYAAQKYGKLGKGESTDIFGTVKRLTLRTLSAGLYSPDSYDTFLKYMPGNVGKMQIAVPWNDQYDRCQYLDGTFFLPWGDMGELGKGEIGKRTFPWLPRQIEPSNPYFQLGVAAMTGKDIFTGHDIIPAGSVGSEAFSAWAKFLMQSWGPSLTPGAGWGAQSIQKSFSGDFTNDPNVKSRGASVAADIFGARARPVDPRSSYRFRVYDLKADLDSNMQEIRRLAPEFAKAVDREGITPEQVKAMVPAESPKALIRAVNRRVRLVKEFIAKYPPDELPPSPTKLIDAINAQRKPGGPN